MAAAGRAPDGPRWLPAAWLGMQQIDQRGVKWEVTRVEQGGRVLQWVTVPDWTRRATTTATPDHPDYPSDEAVLEATRQARRAVGKAWR